MNARRGFTLIEVILSVTLTLGLLLSVYSMYGQVMDLRKGLSADAADLAVRRNLMTRITTDCHNAIVYPLPQIDPETGEMSQVNTGLVGGIESVQFVAVRLPGAAAWASEQIADAPIPAEPDVEMVTYRLARDKETYQPLGIERVTQRVLGWAAQEEDAQAVLVSRDMFGLFFRYHNGAGWLDNWSGRDLPLAVEVWMSPTPLPEDLGGEDAVDFLSNLPEVYRRVIYLPGGTKAQSLPFAGRGAPGGGNAGGGRVGEGSVGGGTRPGGGL